MSNKTPKPGSAKEKLADIEKILDEHFSIRSMDNQWPDKWAQEMQAVLDGTRCRECGAYPGSMYDNTEHYMNCSKARKP